MLQTTCILVLIILDLIIPLGEYYTMHIVSFLPFGGGEGKLDTFLGGGGGELSLLQLDETLIAHIIE